MSSKPSGGRVPYSNSATRTDDAPEPIQPTLDATVQDHLGGQLRALYATFTGEALPQALLDLIARLEQTLSGRESEAAGVFQKDLLAALPALRGFALSLAAPPQADDLVQETLLKAWQNQHRFTPGTNFNAWLFTILRNLFYTHHRKRRREVEDPDGIAAAQLIALPNQEHTVTLEKVAFQLRKLPPGQREALVLVGAQGMTYEEAAQVMNCQIGTVKSRVSRSRAVLAEAIGIADHETTRVGR